MSDNHGGSMMRGMFGAFAAGAVLGAGLAILFAPRSGRETREMVGKRMHDLKDAAGNAIAQGKHLLDEGRQKAHEVFEKGKETAREVGSAATRSS